MNAEQLEFAITQYLDGDLPPEEVGALEARLAADAAARDLLEAHRRLTAALRGLPGPEVEWGELSRDLSAVVTGSVDEQTRAQDQKLNAVLRAGVGAVPAMRWDALAAHLSAAIDAEVEAEVRGAGDEQSELDRLLHAAPLPAINWERLASEISGAVAAAAPDAAAPDAAAPDAAAPADAEADADAPAPIRLDEARRSGRYGSANAWVRTLSRLAVAAVVAIAAIVGVRVALDNGAGDQGGQNGKGPDQVARTGGVTPTVEVGPKTGTGGAATVIVEVTGPREESAAGKAVVDVGILPGPAFASGGGDMGYRRESRAPVVIAAPAGPRTTVDESSVWGWSE